MKTVKTSKRGSSHSPSSPYFKNILSNGLTLLCIPMKGVQSVTVLALVNTGSRYEKPAWGGISHFLEHMVFKGTEKYPTAQDLAAAVDAVGAEFNAFTSKEYTGYYVKAASEHMPLAIDVVSDMLLTPTLRKDDLDREKGVIVEEINMYNDTPMRHIGDIFEQVLFAGSPLGRDIIGTKETVRGLSREDFVAYVKEWYGLGNVVLTVAGDATVVGGDSIVRDIEHAFSKKSDTSNRKNGGKRALKTFTKKLFAGERVKVEYKKTDQAHFIMAVPGITRTDPQRYALEVLSAIFGGNMSSRLFTEVREKRGLCYYVRSDLDYYHDTGMFGASAGVDPTRVEEAIRVVREEFFHLLDTQGPRVITESELQRAKDYMTGSTILDMEDTKSVANHYGATQLLTGKTETVEEELEKIRAVQLADVRAIAKKLIDEKRLYFVMIGPFEKQEKFAKLMTG